MSSEHLVTELISVSGDRSKYEIIKDITDAVFENPELLKNLDSRTISEVLREAVCDWSKYSKILDPILNFGVNLKPLQIAALRGDIEAAESLLQSGEKPEGPEWYVDSLVKCIFCLKNVEVRKNMLVLFIKNGLNTDFKNESGRSILHIFISCFARKDHSDDTQIAEILIKSGTSVNNVDNFGYTPLLTAVYQCDSTITKLLIENGADVTYKHDDLDVQGYPHMVAASKDVKSLELLLSSGVDVNSKTLNGWTALHRACILDKEQSIRLLLRKGADINAKTNDGRIPFSLLFPRLCTENLDPCISVFVQKFAKLNHENLPIAKHDLNFLKSSKKSKKYFEQCKSELKKMEKTIFYSPYSYYFVLKESKKSIKKLENLTKNEEFIANFKKNLSTFTCYKDDLEKIFAEAIQVRNELAVVEYRLKTIFADYFPEIVLSKLANNLTIKNLPLQ